MIFFFNEEKIWVKNYQLINTKREEMEFLDKIIQHGIYRGKINYSSL